MDRRSFCKVLGFAAGSTLLPGLMVRAAGQSSVGRAVPDGRYAIGIRSDLSGCDLTHTFYYSDSFFTHPATQYDHQLALATLGLVCAAANTIASDAEYWVNGSVGREAHIAAAYEALGFGPIWPGPGRAVPSSSGWAATAAAPSLQICWRQKSPGSCPSWGGRTSMPTALRCLRL